MPTAWVEGSPSIVGATAGAVDHNIVDGDIACPTPAAHAYDAHVTPGTRHAVGGEVD